MKRAILASLMVLAVLPAGAAEKEYRPYIGIQGQKLTWEQGSMPNDVRFDVDSAGAVLGVGLDQIFGLEARYGSGVDNDEIGNVEVDLDRLYGFYVRATLPAEGMFKPYGIVGYSNLRLEFDGEAGDSEDDGSYGLGVSLAPKNSDVQLNAEWLQYINRDGFDVDSVNLGLSYHF